MIFGGKKFKEAAEESGEALRARARRGDDATGRTSGTELQGRPQAEAADADALQNGLPSWSPGDPLPNASHAIIGAKFNAYSMDPENKANHGKWKAFERLGYDVRHPDARAAAAQDVERQLRHELLSAGASPGKDSAWGRRLEVSAKLMGPSGRTGTLITVWQYDHGEVVPRLLTNWLKV